MATPKTIKLSRREMLKWSGILTAGSLVAACGPTPAPPTEAPKAEATPVPQPTTAPEPTKAPEPTTPPEPTTAPAAKVEGNVVVMHFRHELTEDEEKQFEADNPGITIDFLQADQTRFFAMYSAGTAPDLFRLQAPSIPQFLARNILRDLTPYFEVSQAIKPADLAPANKYYMANSPLDIGKGKIYGMCKDWSPDFTLFINKKLFADAGVNVPDDTKPLTYDEVFQLARKLAKFEGDRTLVFGYGYGDWWIDRIWMNMLAEVNQTLYVDSFSKMALTTSEEAKKAAKYYFDLDKEKLVASPLNPSPSWNGEDFTKGTVAILQFGYWYSAQAESDITRGQVMTLPAPTWTGTRLDPTMTATGMIMASATKVPDAAWKVFEWYNGKEPAIARAKGGWGVPALKSLYDLMPKETEYQQQVQRVLREEFKYAEATLQFNPFIGETAASDTWAKYREPALRDQMTFDDLLANVEKDVNTAIKEGIDRIMG